MAKRKAFSYVRWSSAKQDSGDSLRRQTDGRTEEYCRAKKLELADTLIDGATSGWTGANTDVGKLGEFLRAVESGKIPSGSVLICETLDRISRQEVRSALTLWLRLLEAGITIVTLDPVREYSPENQDPLPLIEALLLFATANEKSERLSRRMNEAWGKKRERRILTAHCPAWMTLGDRQEDKEGRLIGGRFILDKAKAKTVRKLIDLAMKGMGTPSICKKMIADKVPSLTNGHWNNAYVGKILASPALWGAYLPGNVKHNKGKKTRHKTGEVWENYFPAVLTKDEFDELQKVRAGRRNSDATKTYGKCNNVFAGLIHSFTDGTTMFRATKNFPVLQSTAVIEGKDCDGKTFPFACFETAVLMGIAPRLDLAALYPSDGSKAADNAAGRLIALEGRRETIKAKLAEDPDFDSLVDVLRNLDKQIEDLKKELGTVKPTRSDLDDFAALAELWSTDKDNVDLRLQLRNSIQRVVSSIDVYIAGEKRSKWKTAYIKVRFAVGGEAECFVFTEKDSIKVAAMVPFAVGEWEPPMLAMFDDLHAKNVEKAKESTLSESFFVTLEGDLLVA